MNVSQRLQANREAILKVLSVHGASNPRVFGSVARGEDTEESDLDLLVELPDALSLFQVARLQHELEDLLEHRVDLVTEAELHPRIRDRVLAEAKPL